MGDQNNGSYLKYVYGENLFSDVTLIVGDERIKAHRVILAARSPVFEKMFTSDFIEKQAQEVVIQDDNPQDFKLLLKFLYTSYIDSYAITVELMLLARKYMVDAFFQFCMYKLKNDIMYSSRYPEDSEKAIKCLMASIICKHDVMTKNVVQYFIQNSLQIQLIQRLKDFDKVLNQEDVIKTLIANLLILIDTPEVTNYRAWNPILFVDAENYYNCDQFSDITIKIRNSEIKGHKAILAASSETFAELLAQTYPNKENNELVIDDDIDEHNFHLLLKFLYCQKLDKNEINSKLFYIAFKYKVKSLGKICQFKMVDELSLDNVFEYYSISNALKCDFLKYKAYMFIKERSQNDSDCKIILNKNGQLKNILGSLFSIHSSISTFYRNFKVISFSDSKLLGTFKGPYDCEMFYGCKKQKWLLGSLPYNVGKETLIPPCQLSEQDLKDCFYIEQERN